MPVMASELLKPQQVNQIAIADQYPSSYQALLATLENSPTAFLQPPPSLHAASLVLAKQYIDPLAAFTSDLQIGRQQYARRKRKRGAHSDLGAQRPLQLREIHLDGFKTQQVWQQARRILDASRREAERSLKELAKEEEHTQRVQTVNGKTVRFRDGSQENLSIEHPSSQESDPSKDKFIEDENDALQESYASSEDGHEITLDELEEGDVMEEDDALDGFEEAGDSSEESESNKVSEETFQPDKLGLNDGFFSIDDFNRQSDFLEHQDARGENDGAASDEEDMDWGIDPLAVTPSGAEKAQGENLTDEESDDEEEGGPTFRNADAISESDGDSQNGVEMEDVGAMNNTNDIRYADFFAPPPRKASKSSRRRALPKTQPPKTPNAPREATEDDLQRTISAVRRDIFEDDLTPDEDAQDADEDNDPRSSHQKRQAALTAEIRRLEAAAVAKRDWTLSGEARAADRPINSLLEEDLEFERAGKPIPVITQEVSEDIEALIKRRILAREFDEVIKRRPGNLVTGAAANVRRGRFELEDTKPQQSLAEVYEAEHLKTVDPEGYTDKRDKKLKEEHAKIEQMWKDISAKLDALSSWHYKPKPPSASISVVADVPTIAMEDARPSAGGDVGGESMLAPQEVYKAGEGRDKRAEVLTGSGLPVGRSEMSRDQKVRRRRREKERIRKAGGLGDGKGGKEVGGKTKEKQGIVEDLKKGGVRVIGKKGEITDVEGRVGKERGAVGKGGDGYKL